MTAPNSLPGTGYTIERIYTTGQHLEVKRPGDTFPEEGAYTFGWDWVVVNDRMFDVQVRLGLDPRPTRHEEVRIAVSGRFSMSDETPSVDFENFVRYQAVAILMPYLRETLSSLTGRGFYGPYWLAPINVMRLMQGYDPAKATGLKQIRDGVLAAFVPPNRQIAQVPDETVAQSAAPTKRLRRKAAKRGVKRAKTAKD